MTMAVEVISLTFAGFAVIASIVFAVYVGRSRAERSARGAILDELEARKATNERLGKERDEAFNRAADLDSQVRVLEARTDLSSLSQQIADTTEASVGAIIAAAEESRKESREQHERLMRRMDEQHRELIGMLGGVSALISRGHQQPGGK